MVQSSEVKSRSAKPIKEVGYCSSDYGSVGRAVASNTSGLRLELSHWPTFI